jgi:hypothetical protein
MRSRGISTRFAGHPVAKTRPRAGITDFASVTSLEVSPETIRDLASLPLAMPDPVQPRVIVAPAPDVFGLARMFQLEGEQTRPEPARRPQIGRGVRYLGRSPSQIQADTAGRSSAQAETVEGGSPQSKP